MTQPELTQLGHPTPLPASPDAAVLETVANPAPGRAYTIRLTCPEFTSLWMSRYFRGALSGLGLLNLYIAFAELLRQVRSLFS